MEIYKAKSLTLNIKDEQIKSECGSVRFISFEACIQMFRQQYNLMELKDAPKGYRVTEQGIEILSKD